MGKPRAVGCFIFTFLQRTSGCSLFKDIDVLRQLFRDRVAEVAGGIIEVVPFEHKKLALLKAIIKLPQHASGVTYVASLTMLFKQCSFVIKVQAVETGMTGYREALVVDRLMNGNPSFGSWEEMDWLFDPYDSAIKTGVLMNKSELAVDDPSFPHHPLTIARELINEGLLRLVRWYRCEVADTIRSKILPAPRN